MTDLVTFGETMLRLSSPGQERLERATELEFRAAGAESNVAVNAGRLGLETVWLSKLPDSPLGRKVTSTLEAQGTEAEVVWTEDGRQGTYYVEQASEPRATNVLYDRADAAVTTATVEEIPTDRIAAADAFYTSGITPALSETLADTTGELLSLAQGADTTVAFDVNYRSKLWSPAEARPVLESLFPNVDVLVTALRDAHAVLDADGDAETVARDLAAEWGFETVVVTRGSAGALALRDGTVTEQAAFETETHDAIGTGDAFVGGFLARRLLGDDVPAALEYAAATAALKRTIPGDVALVTPSEVEAVLERAGDDIAR